MSNLHEECGVFGIYSPEPADLASSVYYGLYALQHRGQESCGIVVNDDGVFYSHKDLGLVSEIFTKDVMAHYPSGRIAVGHVRYGTTGGNSRRNCQPIEVNHSRGKMALSHNGNLSNAYDLRYGLEMSGAIFHTTSDTETIAYIITGERLKSPSIEEAVGAEFIRDVEPGEIIVFNKEGMKSFSGHCGKASRAMCIFEYIYFARPDSVIDGYSVHASRRKAGKILAQTCPADADVVIGVPDSGLDAALGFAEESGIPYGIGFIKNKYIGRTFISPGQSLRTDQVKIKLNTIKDTVYGKRVVMIDDSIVRGNTCGRIVKLLRDAGAAEVHVRISAPPFLNPCYYGTDIDSRDNLIACHHTVDEIASIIGADSLGYLPLEALSQLAMETGYCSACFSGDYPTDVPENTTKDRFEQKLHI